MLHHAFVQTHPEPTSQRYITKPRAVRFSSHTSVLNFAGTAFHVTPRMWANPSWTNVPRHTTSHTSLFWTLPEQPGTDDTTHVCRQPWTNVPKIHHKTSDRKIFISHICFELCRRCSPCYTTHVCQPILNQRPKTHYKLQIRKFSSQTSLFWTLPEQPGTDDTTHVCRQPWTNVPKIHHKTSDPKIFISHICFELCRRCSPCYTTHVCQPILNQRPKTHYKLQIRFFSSHTSLFWTLPEQLPMLHHTCEPTHPEPTSQDTLQTSDLKIFISHIPVLNFAGTDYTTHVSQPILNRRPKTHYKLQIRFVWSHTSLFWACYTTHVSQPILYQRPKIHHKRLMTQFCKPILIQPPKIHLSKFQCSPYRRQKCRALQEDKVEWPVCDLQAKMVLSKLQWLKLPAPNLLQKCSQEVFPRLKSFGFMVYLKSQF